LKNAEKNWRTLICTDLMSDKIVIRYQAYTEDERDYYPGREVLFITSQDKVIDNFGELIRRMD
jgi:hypothetical protein